MTPDEMEVWRCAYAREMRALQLEAKTVAALAARCPMSAEDCAFLWDVGVRADEDIDSVTFLSHS